MYLQTVGKISALQKRYKHLLKVVETLPYLRAELDATLNKLETLNAELPALRAEYLKPVERPTRRKRKSTKASTKSKTNYASAKGRAVETPKTPRGSSWNFIFNGG